MTKIFSDLTEIIENLTKADNGFKNLTEGKKSRRKWLLPNEIENIANELKKPIS